MANQTAGQFRPRLERLDDREVPALLSPVTSASPGNIVAVGDVNHDGRDDVVAFGARIGVQSAGYFNYRYGILSGTPGVRLSNGDGTFRAAAKLNGCKGYYLNAVTVADVNEDGHPDVTAIAYGPRNAPGTFAVLATRYTNVWLGWGDGRFQAVQTTSAPGTAVSSWPVPVTAPMALNADVNRDGIADAASVSTAANAVTVSLGVAGGSYRPAQVFAAGPSPGAIAVGDFNGDGWIDLLVVNDFDSNSPALSVLRNDGIW